jgi:hypothetical protein
MTAAWQPGDRVEGRVSGSGDWKPGRLLERHEYHNMWLVAYDDRSVGHRGAHWEATANIRPLTPAPVEAWQPTKGDRANHCIHGPGIVRDLYKRHGDEVVTLELDGGEIIDDYAHNYTALPKPAPVEAPRFAVGDRVETRNYGIPGTVVAGLDESRPRELAPKVLVRWDDASDGTAESWEFPTSLRPAPAAPPEAAPKRLCPSKQRRREERAQRFAHRDVTPPNAPPDLVPSTRCACGAPQYMPLVGPGECMREGGCTGAPKEAEPDYVRNSYNLEAERVWFVGGRGVERVHPLRDEAIAAWRAAVRR